MTSPRPSIRLGAVAPIGMPASGLRCWAEQATTLGLEHLVVTDHVVGASAAHQADGWDEYFPHAAGESSYSETTPFNEPLVSLGYLAATTPLELVTGVLVLPQRNTVVVAKEAAQIDLLSQGRLRLGVSIGWNRAEYAALSADYASRGRRFTEQIELLRRLWTEDLVFFEGEFHQVHGVALSPLPVQRPVPLWLGGASPEHGFPKQHLLERMARLGDGWYFDAGVEPTDTTAAAMAEVYRLLEAHGRDRSAFGVDARLNLARVPEDGVLDVARRWRDLGVTHLTIDTRNADQAGWPHALAFEDAMPHVVDLVRQGVAA